MRSLTDYINRVRYVNVLKEEFSVIESEEILNEAFESSILRKLAEKIKKYETPKKRRRQELVKDGRWVGSNDQEISFASIFGPKEKTQYKRTQGGLEGLKWNQIKDDNFEKLSMPDDAKKIKKLLNEIYTKGKQTDIIGTLNDEVVWFIKGYRDKDKNATFYYFQKPDDNGYNHGVKKGTKTKYSYQTRDLKWNEVFEILEEGGSNYVLYILNVTNDMIQQYNDLFVDRKEAKVGMINFDDESLKKLAKEQKARYEALVQEMKTKKLEANSGNLIEEIRKVQNEVMGLYDEAIKHIEDTGRRYQFGTLMQYISYAYEQFYNYLKYNDEAKKAKAEFGDDYDKYAKANAERAINDAKYYLDKINKGIEQYKAGEDVWV